MKARYYDPRTGRFLSEDPIGLKGKDSNLYRYVKNNPIILSDPSGNGLVAGGICAIVDVGYNTASGVVDYMTHTRNAGIYQQQINNINQQINSLNSNNLSCLKRKAELQSQVDLLQKQVALELAQASNSIAGAIGGTLVGGLICGGVLALPTP